MRKLILASVLALTPLPALADDDMIIGVAALLQMQKHCGVTLTEEANKVVTYVTKAEGVKNVGTMVDKLNDARQAIGTRAFCAYMKVKTPALLVVQ